MFVEKLTAQEKRSLVQLLTFIARSDGKVEQQEWNYLNRFCNKNGLTYDINEENDLEHICGAIQSRQAKIVALQHVVRMALSDGNYQDIERQHAKQIASALGIKSEHFKYIEGWAVEGFEWKKKGEAMLSGEGWFVNH